MKKIINCKVYFEEKGNLQKNFYRADLYYFDEDNESDKKLINNIVAFIESHKEILPIIEKNISLCNPKVFKRISDVKVFSVSLGGSIDDILDIFNDFIHYTISLLLTHNNIDKKLEEYWNDFEKDFLNDEINITFIANISNFYFQSGGIIKNLIPTSNIKISYLNLKNNENKNIYFTLKKNFRYCYINSLAKELDEYNIIISYQLSINKFKELNKIIESAEDIFNKICFIIRLICKGSAHYDFIRPFYLGNYSSDKPVIKEFPENHLLTYNNEDSIVRNGPFETWIQRLWEYIYFRDYSKWILPNQKIRDSYYRSYIVDEGIPYDEKFKFFREIERLIDLIQALENLMGGL
ncbi:MAG: hypothetical protein H8E13_00230 [Actinobacteria bacterium]|nr:hypothetical protein [Actinomycetota bacterium]